MRVSNTLSGKKEEFLPQDNEVKMYVCGVTPYDDAHIGHAMSYIIFDVIRRYLKYRGYKVKYVQNVTDIDDKIINRANERGIPPRELAEQYTSSFHEDMERLNVLPPDVEPRATEMIPDIIRVVKGLVDKGHAYAAQGSVYFRVNSAADYGKLAHRSLEQMMAGARIEVGEEKEHPMDFVLWKASKPGEPAWDSPWGKGRPGWHIECSVMSLKYLGETLDIHGGGQDLIFPHHENEIAQSESFTGVKPFVKHWLHNGLLQLGQEKMSKSLGNLITIKEALAKYSADAIRIFVLNSHYRSPLTYSEEALEAAERGAERLRQAVHGEDTGDKPDKWENEDYYSTRFGKVMDDDFNTPQALALLFNLAKEINWARDEGYITSRARKWLMEHANVLGLTLISKVVVLDKETTEIRDLLIEFREQQRRIKQWQMADRIRNLLANLGIATTDTPKGTSWNPRGMHFFNVSTNLCQRFLIGYEQQKDNFYLKGETLGNRPVVSCRILNNKGEFIYGLERNNLTPDSHPIYRFMLTKEGWHKVVDDTGNELLRIESRVDEHSNTVTYIFGTFFDKDGRLAAEGKETGLLVNCPLQMG